MMIVVDFTDCVDIISDLKQRDTRQREPDSQQSEGKPDEEESEKVAIQGEFKNSLSFEFRTFFKRFSSPGEARTRDLGIPSY